jgi:hypothetical protein
MLFPAPTLVNAAYGISHNGCVSEEANDVQHCRSTRDCTLHDSRMPTSLRLSSNKGVIGPEANNSASPRV